MAACCCGRATAAAARTSGRTLIPDGRIVSTVGNPGGDRSAMLNGYTPAQRRPTGAISG